MLLTFCLSRCFGRDPGAERAADRPPVFAGNCCGRQRGKGSRTAFESRRHERQSPRRRRLQSPKISVSIYNRYDNMSRVRYAICGAFRGKELCSLGNKEFASMTTV